VTHLSNISTFILKIILGTIFATLAGDVLASQAEFSDPNLGRFAPGFIFTVFPLACFVIMQWLLLSEYLPKWWVTLGIIGSVVAGIIVGIMFLYISNETYNAHTLLIGSLREIVSGALVALPQYLLLKRKKGYLWILANGLGKAIEHIVWYAIFYPPINDGSFLPSIVRMLVLQLPVILFGLSIGFYLYYYVVLPKKAHGFLIEAN
jgi:uncharacterized membrane protein YeaQ/YmgE (transglycosylase-associated protein family)